MNAFIRQLGFSFDASFILTFASMILIRITMVFSTIPFLIGKPVPASIRMGFSLILTIFLYPFLAPSDHSLIPQAPMLLFMIYIKETFYGVAIGIVAGIIFHAFEGAGGVVDNQRGAAQARLLIPQLGEQSSLFGNLNFMLGLVIFLSIGGHLLFLKALVESYRVLPVLEFPHGAINFYALTEEFIKDTGIVLVTALQLSAPILISIFVADVVLGIMSKAAPAINVHELGFAVKGVLGVFIYFLAFELIATQMGKISLMMIDQVERVLRILALTPA